MASGFELRFVLQPERNMVAIVPSCCHTPIKLLSSGSSRSSQVVQRPCADQAHSSSRIVARSPLGRVMTTSILHTRFSLHPHRSQAQGVDLIAETAPLRLIAFAPLAGVLPPSALQALDQKARCKVLARAGFPRRGEFSSGQLSLV